MSEGTVENIRKSLKACERLLEQQKRAAEAAAAAREIARLDALQAEREQQVQSLQLSERGRIIALQLASVSAMRQQSIEQWAETMQRLERIDAELAAADAEQARRDAERAEHERRMAEQRAELERQQAEQRELQRRIDAERQELELQRQAIEEQRLKAEREAAAAQAEKHRAAQAAEREQARAEHEAQAQRKRLAETARMERLRPMLQDIDDLVTAAIRQIGQTVLERHGERAQHLVIDDLSKAALRIKDALIREIE